MAQPLRDPRQEAPLPEALLRNAPLASPPETTADADGWWRGQAFVSRFLYWGIHASCLLVFVVGATPAAVGLFAATFLARMFGITAGYHRYFAHKSYKTSRAFQLFLAILGDTAVQKGVLWWAGHHRVHHKYADQPGKDPHSPRDGFWNSHQGWIFNGDWDDSDLEEIPDFARYPELVWLNKWHIVPPALLAAACYLAMGWIGVIWGFSISTVMLWHTTYSINSLAHRIGTRRYDTPDDSRNNWWLGVLTLGEGWHNNHHHFCSSARQGFFWWEIDISYYLLRGLAAVGLVWDLREPPARVLSAGRARG